MENLNRLIQELCNLPSETAYVEIKHDNYTPDMIGKDISGLANSAALFEKRNAYTIWGIADKTHSLIGTDKDLQTIKKGGQELENWLRSMLSPNADFEYQTTTVSEKAIGVLTISAAAAQTVTFQKEDYIRIGSYTKKLRDYPAIKAKLWDKLRNENFEARLALTDLPLATTLQKLDISTYFDLLSITPPDGIENTAHPLLEDGILVKHDNGLYGISNLAAILFAKNLADFPKLLRKAIRIVQYQGNNRMEMQRDEVLQEGYAAAFEQLITYIEALLPSREVIVGALRRTIRTYPTLALRETIGNALIHQDFSLTGTGPVVEIFANRMEVTNPGTLLVDLLRIIDNPPKSRNERLASLMRRMNLCEELGTGWDKIVLTSEAAHLPAPKIELFEENTRVTLYAETPFNQLSAEDRLWACYLHACIQQTQHEQLTDHSLRTRFSLPDSSAGSISRLIKEAIQKKLIKPLGPDTAPRYMKYIPIWA